MTSYGGIIRIRLWVEVDDFLSACRYKLPCILLQAHYTRFIRKMQALPWEGGRGAAFVLVFWKKHGTIRVRTAFPGKAFFSVGLVWVVSSVAEFLIYTPMLGSGGGYLAFVTGNLINMKIPCAVTARDTVGTKVGTKENEVISTLSIATSSLVTILVLALGVAALTPLRPVLQSPALQPAFENVVPALFGAMACKYYRHNLKLAMLPLGIMGLLFILVPSLTGSTSMLIIPSGAIAIGFAFLEYKKAGKKKEEKKT